MARDSATDHLGTELSLLDGACHLGKLGKAAKEMGMKAMAITEHGAMFGAVGWASACKKAGIKPIVGCESYMALGSRQEKSGGGIARARDHERMTVALRLPARPRRVRRTSPIPPRAPLHLEAYER
ncbi:MAG: PHP domain-containing protein [Vicinamibacteria bacterium]|nr:PHP domain-containing protein [Vicinamibacteria bacterium]